MLFWLNVVTYRLADYENESDEMRKQGVDLSPELWVSLFLTDAIFLYSHFFQLVKLLLGAIDNSYDRKDEKGGGAPPPQGGYGGGQYGGPPQQGGYPPQQQQGGYPPQQQQQQQGYGRGYPPQQGGGYGGPPQGSTRY
jgi:hypothetical protein